MANALKKKALEDKLSDDMEVWNQAWVAAKEALQAHVEAFATRPEVGDIFKERQRLETRVAEIAKRYNDAKDSYTLLTSA